MILQTNTYEAKAVKHKQVIRAKLV